VAPRADGCWAAEECGTLGDCCWQNRTIPHDLEVLRNYTRQRGGSMVVVPDGCVLYLRPAFVRGTCLESSSLIKRDERGSVAFPTSVQRKHGQKAMPTAAEQRVRATRDQKYYKWCYEEDLCVAMWVFLWRSVHTSTGWLTGVEDQTEVLLPALTEIGSAIKSRTVPPNTAEEYQHMFLI
jgi:hypothetical protein